MGGADGGVYRVPGRGGAEELDAKKDPEDREPARLAVFGAGLGGRRVPGDCGPLSRGARCQYLDGKL